MRDAVAAFCIAERRQWVERLTADMSRRICPTAVAQRRIGIVGALGSNDVGDEAMLVSVIDELRKRDPGLEFVAFSRKPDSTAAYVGVDSVPDLRALVFNRRHLLCICLYMLDRAESALWRVIPQRWVDPVWREGWLRRAVYALLRRYLLYRARRVRAGSVCGGIAGSARFLSRLSSLSALVLLGGGYLNSWHVKADSHLWAITIEVAAAFGIPVYATGLNLGPFNRHDQRRIAVALNKCILLGVRDRFESADRLKAMGIYDPNRCFYSCDDAIALRTDTLGNRYLVELVRKSQPYAVIQLHRWLLNDRALRKLVTQVACAVRTAILQRGFRVVLAPMTFGVRNSGDRDVLSVLASKLDDHYERVEMLPPDLHPSQIKYVFAHARVSLVSRHHGAVFSVGSGVPVVALVYDRYYQMKLQAIADESGGCCRLVGYGMDVSARVVEAVSSILAMPGPSPN